MCLAAGAETQTFGGFDAIPAFNAERDRIRCDADAAPVFDVAAVEPLPSVMRVEIRGPLLQYAGAPDVCSLFVDGHDAVCARLCAAFEMGDVLLIGDSPGGAAAGLFEGIRRAQDAKAKHGRRCTGFTEATVGSATFAWLSGLCDEVYLSPDGRLGSIGARAAHDSRALADAKDGIVHTAFAWPGAGKLALDPQAPISDQAAARMQRDINQCGEMFANLVLAGAAGKRGLTMDAIMALDADMLTGQAAVAARLADGVDSLEAVERYALALAASPEMTEAAPAADGATPTGATSATGDRAMAGMRAEGDEPEKDDGEEDAKGPGAEPTPDCKSCGMNNSANAKFCAQCGESMAAKPMASDEEEPPPSKPAPPVAKPGAAASTATFAPPAMSTDATLASILGATGESPLALKAAAIGLRRVRDTAAGVTGKSRPGEIVGGLLALPEQLEDGKRARSDLAKQTRDAERKERWSLAHRLNALNLAGRSRSTIFEDKVDDSGKRVAVALMPEYVKMDVDVFRGLVASLEKNAPARKATPFEPNRVTAEAASLAASGDPKALASGEPNDAQIEAAMSLAPVKQLAAQSGRPVKAVALQYLKTRAALASQNGQVTP